MWSMVWTCLLFLLMMLCWNDGWAQDQAAFIRVSHQQVVIVRYWNHEYPELQQVVADNHLEMVDEEEEPDGLPPVYNNLSTFIAQVNSGGISAGWMLGSPVHLNQNVVLEPVAVPQIQALIPQNVPIVCQNYFQQMACPAPNCRLVHLTDSESQQIRDSARYLFPSGELRNAEICTMYYNGECRDPHCPKLHVLFEDQKAWRAGFQ